MATRTVVIDGIDREHFFLSVDGDTLRIGQETQHPEGILRGLRIHKIRCEIEVDDDGKSVNVDDDTGEFTVLKEVRSGQEVTIGQCHVNLRSSSPSITPPPVTLRPRPATDVLPKRLHVIDGADMGRMFGLPDSGTITIGKSAKHTDIYLHDLFVSRVHCSLTIDGNDVVVTHHEGDKGTLIDGIKIDGPTAVMAGNIIRIGNSYLRLETGIAERHHQSESTDDYEVLTGSSTKTPTITRKPSDPLEGQLFGHFRLAGQIGKGWTAVTYKALDTKTDRVVALKQFPAEFPASNAELERFAREIKAVLPIQHPHLVGLYGAGKSGTQCWIAREFIDGESVEHLIRRVADGEKLNWSRALRITVHLARALEELHRHHQVHGDVTPRNILVKHEEHSAHLADLGLTKALTGSQLMSGIRTAKEEANVGYLAPEQMETGAFVDDLADLYSVGAIAYAILAGRPPFVGDSISEIRQQILHTKPTRVSTYHKKVPIAFESAIMKLLAKLQEDRYQTARQLLDELEPLANEFQVKV